MRIGFGYDVHRLEKGDALILGGISIPASVKAVGHSDADVLIHAICDALLGAASLGDIGHHFPDTDAALKGIDSKVLLKKVIALLQGRGYSPGNIDSTVALESPKIAPHLEKMRTCIAEITGLPVDKVSIKATTNEKLGFVGRGEGICAWAITMINDQ